jgi:condensin complex subunit 2
VPFNDAASNATSSGAEQMPHCSTQANATMDHIPTEFQNAPERVAKIIIPYAKTAKVVDMKQLKFCCWRLITEKSQPSFDDVVVASGSNQIPGAQPQGVMFHEVMQQLPKILSKNMADSISISLAFYSILHLANEKNLELDQDEDLKDFRIVKH